MGVELEEIWANKPVKKLKGLGKESRKSIVVFTTPKAIKYLKGEKMRQTNPPNHLIRF